MPRVGVPRHKKHARKQRVRKSRHLRGDKGGLRRYGPGKFDLDIDGYVHGLALEGWGDGLGDVADFGHYHCLNLGRNALREIERKAKLQKDTLTTAENNLIRGSAGAILSENDQGFVSVEYFKTKKSLDRAWDNVEREYEKSLQRPSRALW